MAKQMNLNNYTRKAWIGLSFCFVLLTACQKDNAEPKEPATVSFPEKSTVTYGEQLRVPLPEGYGNGGTVQVDFSADQTKDYVFSDGNTLRQKLVKAARYDAEQHAIFVDSRLLYPTGTSSITSAEVLPSQYIWTVKLSTNLEQDAGLGYLHVTVDPAAVNIEGAEQDAGTAFAYGLYGEVESAFALSAMEDVKKGADWYLPVTEFAAVREGKIVFDASVSESKGEEETVVNSQPSLVKDGFVVASTPFRMIFIPKIKYLFGQYYPDLDITIDYSTVHIGLSNGYLSAAPVFYPDKYKSTFRLKAVEKNGVPFANSGDIFEVEESSGKVRVKPSENLTAGSYKVYVEAVSSTGLVFVTTLTLGMS
ncbi:hypothetical protein H8B06_12905 [Sphingobacterium sp. DN00404]|uniref:DUF1735 domain-containing protein n=1 Tax=Sphingobacterium micropteri TaxID=2763501 RepID=A0ABR7YR96_9SPHI|nr:hypothetical protein [Sphingobacterium micropteri]MBD1433731.1 hypothetical protein [Sphingobacterium micropteri]